MKARLWPHGSRRLLAQAPHHEGFTLARGIGRRLGRAADIARRTRRAVVHRRTRRKPGRRGLARRGRGVAEAAEQLTQRWRGVLRRSRRLLLLRLQLSGLTRLHWLDRLPKSGLTGLQ